jgi:hypothetical protein
MIIKQIPAFLRSLAIATFLWVTHTTATNLIWLHSINMPVDSYLVLSTMATDLIGMNSRGAFPTVALIFIGLLLAFITARFISTRTAIKKTTLYAMAGGTALFAIVALMPSAFYNLDLIAGARTITGRVYLVLAGALAGYYCSRRWRQCWRRRNVPWVLIDGVVKMTTTDKEFTVKPSLNAHLLSPTLSFSTADWAE